MESELKAVGERLNKLCAQHDELMSLLEIHEHIPTLRSLHSLNRHASSQLSHCQHILEELGQSGAETQLEGDGFIRSREGLFGKGFNEAEGRVDAIKVKIRNYKQQINLREEEKISAADEERDDVKRKLRDAFDSSEEEVARAIAQHKINLGSKVSARIQKEELLQKAAVPGLYQLERVQHEVEERRLRFETPPLLDFCQFTFGVLKAKAIVLGNRSNITRNNIGEKIRRDQEEELIQKMRRGLEFRVKGLRKFCGEELLLKFSREEDKTVAVEDEGKVLQMLQELEALLLPQTSPPEK